MEQLLLHISNLQVDEIFGLTKVCFFKLILSYIHEIKSRSWPLDIDWGDSVRMGCEETLMRMFIISSAIQGRVHMQKSFSKMLITNDIEQAHTYPR